MNDTPELPAALSAFLRGVERRGVVLAELQCGRRETGEIAMAATLRAFSRFAAERPMERWPDGFWSLLAAAPPLQQDAEDAAWEADVAALGVIAPADRLALLLRLAAGLEEAQAAPALGLDRDGYRAALARACPRDGEGRPDVEAWRALAQAVQQRVRQLPAERIAHLQRLRERMFPDAVAPSPAPQAANPAPALAPRALPPAAARRGGWKRVAVWILLVLAVAAGAVWLWRHGRTAEHVARAGAPDDGALGLRALAPDAQVGVEPLSDAPAAAPPQDALLASADFDQLLDPQGAALAAEAGFLAWYAADPAERLKQAQALTSRPSPQDGPAPVADAPADPTSPPETDDDAL